MNVFNCLNFSKPEIKSSLLGKRAWSSHAKNSLFAAVFPDFSQYKLTTFTGLDNSRDTAQIIYLLHAPFQK